MSINDLGLLPPSTPLWASGTMQAERYNWPPPTDPWQPARPAAGRAGDSSRARPHAPTTGAAATWQEDDLDSLTIEQLQQRTEQRARAIEQSTARALRVAENATQVGAETLAALQTQHEQLHHIRDEQRRIEDNLATSERLLKGMESWRGAATNALSSWWYGSSGSTPAAAGDPPSLAARTGGSRPPPKTSACYGAAPAAAARPVSSGAAGDDALNSLSGIVSGLCVQANAMNAELHAQSATLDAAVTSADSHSVALQRNTKRTQKLSSW